VWLRPENINKAYQEAGRPPKSGRAFAILKMVLGLKENISQSWIRKYLEDIEANIEIKKSASPFLPDDEKGAQAVLNALKAINDQNNEEYLERVFSLKCFGDSKFFEKHVRKKVVNIIKKYLLYDFDYIEPLTDDEILAQVGIVRSPEQVDFCGGIVGKLAGEYVDFSIFTKGITINSYTVKEIEIIELKSIQKVLFIENKANYIDYILKKRKENELVIFHGGFYSPVKGLFFKKISEIGNRDEITFYHWSDIDVGGFRIYNRLKTNIIPELKPFLMDKEAFLSQKQYWIKFDEKYGSILEGMLNKDEFTEFHDVISNMLEVKSKLEQEAFLFQSVDWERTGS
ncbi:MAG: hypothetical protein GXY86_13360, partial [Firmicutes bacterium]|nr:hypothetical protein [Bacillota bacterium]